jgi:hypothetical protein
MHRSVEEGSMNIIIDMINDNMQVEKIQHFLAGSSAMVISNINDYLSDNHMQMDTKIKSFHDLYYDDYMGKSETLFVITDISKREWRKLRNDVVGTLFYPLNMIRIMRDDSVEKTALKIKTHSKIDRFYDKYTLLSTNNIQKMHHEVFDTIKATIKACPYCRGESFTYINDVEEFEKDGHSINDSGVFGSFAEHLNCNICHKTISSKMLTMICGTLNMSTLRMR